MCVVQRASAAAGTCRTRCPSPWVARWAGWCWWCWPPTSWRAAAPPRAATSPCRVSAGQWRAGAGGAGRLPRGAPPLRRARLPLHGECGAVAGWCWWCWPPTSWRAAAPPRAATSPCRVSAGQWRAGAGGAGRLPRGAPPLRRARLPLHGECGAVAGWCWWCWPPTSWRAAAPPRAATSPCRVSAGQWRAGAGGAGRLPRGYLSMEGECGAVAGWCWWCWPPTSWLPLHGECGAVAGWCWWCWPPTSWRAAAPPRAATSPCRVSAGQWRAGAGGAGRLPRGAPPLRRARLPLHVGGGLVLVVLAAYLVATSPCRVSAGQWRAGAGGAGRLPRGAPPLRRARLPLHVGGGLVLVVLAAYLVATSPCRVSAGQWRAGAGGAGPPTSWRAAAPPRAATSPCRVSAGQWRAGAGGAGRLPRGYLSIGGLVLVVLAAYLVATSPCRVSAGQWRAGAGGAGRLPRGAPAAPPRAATSPCRVSAGQWRAGAGGAGRLPRGYLSMVSARAVAGWCWWCWPPTSWLPLHGRVSAGQWRAGAGGAGAAYLVATSPCRVSAGQWRAGAGGAGRLPRGYLSIGGLVLVVLAAYLVATSPCRVSAGQWRAGAGGAGRLPRGYLSIGGLVLVVLAAYLVATSPCRVSAGQWRAGAGGAGRLPRGYLSKEGECGDCPAGGLAGRFIMTA
ncbi:hypothetical protein ACJJTC_002763 [Scirpophaga incertulas]